MGESFQWKAKETLVVSATEVIVDRNHNRPLLLQQRGRRLSEESLRKVLAPGEKALLGRKAEERQFWLKTSFGSSHFHSKMM